MAFYPLVHEVFESVRFGRVLFVEIAPPPAPGLPCRYCDVLAGASRAPHRTHFSVPERAARQILAHLERGLSVDAIVLGGAGEPLRHEGVGLILRRLRSSSHLKTVVLTNGVLLGDRDVRREAGEADTVVAWLPALDDRSAGGESMERREAHERHLEGIVALRRETPTHVALEIPVRPGENDGEVSLEVWRRAVERVRPHRVFVVAGAGGDESRLAESLERARAAIHPEAGAFLDDGSLLDRRCWCEQTADLDR